MQNRTKTFCSYLYIVSHLLEIVICYANAVGSDQPAHARIGSIHNEWTRSLFLFAASRSV